MTADTEKPLCSPPILPRLGMVVTLCALPGAAAAYVGPGAGLGLIGSLLAVLAAVLFGLFGLIVLPIRLLLKKKRAQKPADPVAPRGSERESEPGQAEPAEKP